MLIGMVGRYSFVIKGENKMAEDFTENCPLFNDGVPNMITILGSGGTLSTAGLAAGASPAIGHAILIAGANVTAVQLSTTSAFSVALCKNSTTTQIATANISTSTVQGETIAMTLSGTAANYALTATDVLILHNTTSDSVTANHYLYQVSIAPTFT